MTKSFRRRTQGVLDLVDDPPDPGVAVTPSPAPVPVMETFDEFYRREFPRLLLLARALTGATSAEDVAQETMMVAYRRWPQIALLDSPAGYVRGICLHKGASVLRRLGVERRALARYAARPVAQLDPLTPDSERFWAEVRRLPQRQAQATALFYALDLPVAEIAETLGCSEGSVKTHLSRGRAKLADRLGISEASS